MKPLALLSLLLLLQACVSTTDWPASLPERSVFNAAYQADHENRAIQTRDEYLTWVRRFYEGFGPMPLGWNDMTAVVLSDLEGELYRKVASRRDLLGALISAEWAKDNSVRNIDSAMLNLWGAVILSVPDTTQRVAALDLLIADAQALLDGRLFPEDINDQRYQERLGITLEP